MGYKLGSLFDGSGGFPLAGSLCGIEPVWASEVEPYPIAVTRERFPHMKHLGDISKINGAEIEPVDIITFGSPCQDLSVAGKRAGLKHEANGDEETTRSGLFMEAVRIIKEMRKATNGQYPTFALWENVPGAFSSNKGEDFRIVCEELIKVVEPSASMPPVPQNGWNYADSYIGDGWSLAYRVFDAQYWGVPQRRRRIHLIADFRGERAREILFERDGLRGYFAESRTPWQTTAKDAQGSVRANDRAGEVDGGIEVIERRRHLDAVAYAFDSLASNSMKSKNPYSGCRSVEIAKTLDTTDPNPSKNQGGIAVVEPFAASYDIGEARLRTPSEYIEKSPTITARCGTGGNNVPALVKQVYCLQANGIDRTDTAGCNGKGVKEGIGYTLNTIDRHAVAYGVDCRNASEQLEQTGALQSRGSNSINSNNVIRRHYTVRRLTPTECARLQGFADWWAHIEPKDNLTDEEYRFWLEVRNTHAAINGRECKEYTKAQMLTWYNKLYTDSAEYKMWGNGIALPPALYVLQGMADILIGKTNTDNEGEIREEATEPTDLSDAPEDIKEEIIENAKKLEERETVKETTEETMKPTNIEEQTTIIENTPADFCAAVQLKRLAEERKALAKLRPEEPRFTNDVRALEYAVNVLEAVGL